MESRSVKVSRAMLTVVAGIAIILSLVILFGEGVFLRREFQGSTGMEWFSFRKSNPELAVYILAESSEIGILMLDLGVMALVITRMAYGRGARWPWYLLAGSHTLGLGGVTWANFSTGAFGVIMIGVVLLALSYTALGLSAGKILRADPSKRAATQL
jgi:hypothetical protein